MWDTIVIGGGPAGMMAAGTAAADGRKVLLIEKNSCLGKKLYLTGKGRCNVTSSLDVDGLLTNIPGNPSFLYSAFYAFDSMSVIEFFEGLGVPLKKERGNRIFPVSDKAGDIVGALESFLMKRKVRIRLNEPVKEILAIGNKITGVKTSKGCYESSKVIVATGGLSYPGTGSTGDGYKYARALGHSITKLYPSLVPLKTRENWAACLQGLSLKNVAVKARADGRVVFEDFGELMFTHYGISGPVVLSASRFLLNRFQADTTVSIDLKPALNVKELDLRILRDFEKYKNKDFKNALDDLLPQKLIPVIIELSCIQEDKKANSVTKEERKRLAGLLKNLTLHVEDTAGFGEAVITSGGVAVDEVNPSTMESKKVAGLYFAGEVLDVDGYTGGFNLQIAFSTGYSAGCGL